MKRQPFVLIEILNWNKAEMTIEGIESIIKNTNYKNYKIAVIDNGSTDRSIEKIRKKFGKKVYIVPLDKNYGFSVGYNKGNDILLKKFDPDYILLMNNDIIVPGDQKNWLKKLVDTFNKFKNAGIVGCKLIYPDGRIQHAGVIIKKKFGFFGFGHEGRFKSDNKKYSKIKKVIAVTGAIMIMPKRIWNELNGFDEDFYPFDSEDIDICFRLRKNLNKECIYNGSVKLIHKESYSKEKNFRSKLISYSNGILFVLKHPELKHRLNMLFTAMFLPPLYCIKNNKKVLCLERAASNFIIKLIANIYLIYKLIKIELKKF